MKRFIFAAIAAVLLLGGVLVHVQVSQAQQQALEPDVLTEVFVSDITVANSARSGSSVSGSFTIHNVGTTVRSQVQYRLELVQLIALDDGDWVPSEAIHMSPISDAMSLQIGATVVPFEYQLPSVLPEGSLGLLVQVYEQGMTPTAYEFVPIDAEGARATYVAQSAIVVLNDVEAYDVLEGPVVAPTEKVQIDWELYQETGKPVVLTPLLQIFAGTYEQAVPVYEQPFAPITVASEELFATQFTLPVGALESGVYTAVLTLESATVGVAVAPIEARIIVDGLQPKIKNVTYSNTDLTQTEDQFEVAVTYTDVPVNLRRNADGTFIDARTAALFATSSDVSVIGDPLAALLPSGMTASVRIVDTQTREVLGEQELTFDTRSPQAAAIFKNIVNVNEVGVDVVLMRDGIEIDTFTDTVLVASRNKQNMFVALWHAYPIHIISSVTVLLLIGVIVLFVRRAKNAQKREPIIRG